MKRLALTFRTYQTRCY